MPDNLAAAAGAGREFATAPTVPEARRVSGATPTDASVRPTPWATRGTSWRDIWVVPATRAWTAASRGTVCGTAEPASFTVVRVGRSRVRDSGAPRTDLTMGGTRRGGTGERSTTTGTTGVDTASGLSTRSSASEPKDGALLRSPRSADTVRRPPSAASSMSAARTNRWSASGWPASRTFAASLSALAAVTRPSVCVRFVTNGNGLRPESGSSIWW